MSSREIDDLADALVAGVAEGFHGVVLTGAPGIGKSTTLEALGRVLLAHRFDARHVAADDLGWQRPFRVITDLLGLDPVYPPRPDTVDHVLAALESLCRTGPVALCLDDAHRADPDSLALLARLPDLARDLPVVIALARRTAPDRPALSAFSARAGVITVAVTGLGARSIEGLVHTRYGATAGARLRSLLAAAEGNPLRIRTLLDELDRRRLISVAAGTVSVADGDHDLSASVEAGVRAHLDLLDRPAHGVLQILAVWGGSADLATIAEVMGAGLTAPIEPADIALEAGVLRWTDDEQIAFSHDLYRDVVLADLDPPVRRMLHTACAEVLRRRGERPPVIARHTAQADGADAAAALRAAAAELQYAPMQTAELLAEAAAHVTDDLGHADDIAVERAGALAISGQVEDAERVARERLALSRDPATHAALRGVTLFCLISGAQVDAALDQIEQSAARAPNAEARASLADVRRWVGLLGGRQVLEGPPAAVAASGSGLICDAIELFLTARPEDGYQRAVRAAAVRGEHRSRPWLDSPTAPVWPAFLALHAYGPGRARELSLNARRDAQKAGRLWLTPYHQFVSAGINVTSGAWDDALAELESGLEAADATGTAWISMPTATSIQILVRRGELTAAEATLRRWRTRALPEQFGLPHVAQTEALLLEAHDAPAQAAELARRCWLRALGGGRAIWPLIAGPDTLRIARAAGDNDLVARIAHDTAAIPLDQARAVAPAARLVAAVVADDPGAAARAAVDYRTAGHVPGEMLAWEEAACLAAARGADEEARTMAARCATLAASLGATTVERRLAARLRRLDVRLGARGARRRPSTGWESLTPTELQVADLVGRGLTSPQVAARLYISPRTVQTHISHILRKLDLRSRVELAAGLARQTRF